MDIFKDEDVLTSFSYLLSRIESFFEKIDFTELKKVCMLRGVPLSSEYKEKINAAHNVDDIFNVLDNPSYCNWLNVNLLKRIAICLDHSYAIKLIKHYEENIYSRKVSNVKKYFSICFDQKNLSLIEEEIYKLEEDLTVGEIFELKELLKEMDIYTDTASVSGTYVRMYVVV